jgi:Lrp/AsnC family leucine-responsive transcriptional regulator
MMQANVQTDDVDRRILSSLVVDSRKSYAQVGQEVGLSTAAVHERVKKLIERGVIERFSLRIRPEAVGLHLTAFVFLRHDGGVHCRDLAPTLARIPEVCELHSVAGEYDFLLKIRTTQARGLEDVLFAIKSIEGVQRTLSTIVLSTIVDEKPPALPLDGRTPSARA